MDQQKNKAFTLVELIIVITILSILATLGFVSFQGYTKDAKDTKKVMDIKNISKSIDIKFASTRIIPEPDDNTTISSLGLKLQIGVVGNNAANILGLNKIPLDPDTQGKYTFSKIKNKYEIGTIINKTSNLGMLDNVYADSAEKIAKLEGSFNEYVMKYNSGGINYYITMPSIILTNVNANINEGVTTTGVVINGLSNVPFTYSQYVDLKTHNNISFTPIVLFSGSTCGPESFEDILSFVDKLQYAYSSIKTPQLNTLQNQKTITQKIDYGMNLISRIGGCNIKTPTIPDVYPTQCGYPLETGSFETYTNNFDLSKSCLFTKVGTGIAEVRAGIGSGGTKGIYLKPTSGSISLVYNVSSKIPFKLSFDANFFLDSGYPYSSFKFLINNVPLIIKGNTENGLGFRNYTSPLLPAGEYAFSISTNAASYQLQDYIYIDNLKIICQGGGGTCGRTEGFEDGPSLIGDNFSFEGFSPIPWNRVTGTGASEGTYGLVTPPLLIGSQQTDIIYNKTFTNTGYLSFDYKLNFWGSTLELYTDGVFTEHWQRRSDGVSTNMSNFATYNSTLLPPGSHQFRLRIGKGWHDGHTAIAYLDNFKVTYCTDVSVIGCGRGDGFEDAGATSPFSQYTFTGVVKTAWPRVTGTGANTGTYGIISPLIVDPSVSTALVFTKTFTQTGTLLFDYKVVHAGYSNKLSVYVDNVLKNYWDFTPTVPLMGGFVTYTSPQVGPGTHTFKIDVFKGGNSSYNDAIMRVYLDNIKIQY